MKLGQDQKVEFKKCFELDHKVSLKLLTTFGIKLIHFAWKKGFNFEFQFEIANFQYCSCLLAN